MKKFLLALVAATMAALAGPLPALAWVDWCDSEPPVTVVTPAGHRVTVNNFLSAPVQDRHLLKNAVVTGYATAGETSGKSVVHIWVWLPHGGAQYVKITSRTERFDQVAAGRGNWGELVELTLTLPID